MEHINLKRVYETPEVGDGFRVLADRLWPRGMRKEYLQYDMWIKDMTPSPGLREWFHEDISGRWKNFSQKYLKELEESDKIPEVINELKRHKTITLLYASKDQEHTHAIILKKFLEKKLKED